MLTDALPDNLEVQEKLDCLITQKSIYIKKLHKRWITQKIPIFSERDIREMNLEYLSNLPQHQGDQTTRGYKSQSNKDSKSWILKQANNWLGWSPVENRYYDEPILFGGDIDFKRNFESLVISDGQSHSINLIWTINNFVKRGNNWA